MHLGHYIAMLHHSQQSLIDGYRAIGEAHADEPDVRIECERFARQTASHQAQLAPVHPRYAQAAESEPEHLLSDLFGGPRGGPLGLLRDLHDLYLASTESDICWTLITQGARGARDIELLDIATRCEREVAVQLAWLRSKMKQAAPQALVVAQ